MPSLKLIAAAALLMITARADYYIDPNSVSIGVRNQWCSAQRSSCPLLCTQYPGGSSTTISNTCNSTTLAYTCVCANGLSPNASEYSQTIPYFQCIEWGQECVAGCGNNNLCQSSCIQNNLCGAQNPTRINVTSTSTMATATASGDSASSSAGVVYTGYGGSAATPSTTADAAKSGAQTALDLGRSYGLVLVFAGLFGGFALML